ncbi:MAG: serine hydrolase domain-containing protein [Rhodospirillaceae bacterium]|nr:serine hydrolase domain-containing protein [Rhodospirillaceae bacterium]
MNPFLGGRKPEVFGRCDPKFQAVADVFADNFTARGAAGEVGASCAIMIDGELVVDLWGGFADVVANRPWQPDTLCCCWSVSKTIGATMVLKEVERGRLDLDVPVARYWTGFGRNGKAGIKVRHLLEHKAALTFVDADLKAGDLYDWNTMIAALETSAPNWPPGEKAAYLNMTQGYLTGGLCQQVNGGRRLGQAWREDVAVPLALDWHLGVPDTVMPRLATVYQVPSASFGEFLAKNPDSLMARSMKGRDPTEDYNNRRWRTCENGAGASHTNARSMARFYGCLARGGELDGVRLLSDNTLREAEAEAWRGPDPIFNAEARFSTGFELNCPPATPMGPGTRCFGYVGAGGSFAFADPETRIGFGYAHNFMHMGLGPGPCGLPLVEAATRAARSA